MYTINIKENFPPADVAVGNALHEIDVLKIAGTRILKIIHGHGSHARGGLIKQELHLALDKYKHLKVIKDYIKGENLTPSHKLYKEVITLAPDIIVDNDLRVSNFGITIVLI